jgi:signal transduction histidine kinase
VIRSLRLRAFLITWPLVVVATAAVSLAFLRWTRVELDVLHDTVSPGPGAEVVESMVPALVAALGDAAALEATLQRGIDRSGLHLAILGPDGDLKAVTAPDVELVTPGPSPGAGARTFVRSVREGLGRVERTIQVSGRRLTGADGRTVGFLYALPMGPSPAMAPAEPGALGADARRIIWTAFLVASAAAAAAALLLAGPLVSQIGRLSDAATRLRRGELGTRIRPRGRDELGRLERSFNDMAAALERAERRQRDLVADVAHELRSPATNLLGLLEAVEDGLRDPDPETLGLVGAETRLLAELVQDLHELSLADAGQLRLDVQPVDVVAVAASAAQPFAAASASVRLEGPPPGRPVHAMADPRRLHQAIRNLLRNALAHTPAGGRVRVEVEEIAVGDVAARVAIRVRDTGAGIPADHLLLVWERFHRVDPSRSRDGGGRGLGLALVRRFVEEMGGSVAATSEVGVGSCFELRLLPAASPEPSRPSVPAGGVIR